MSNPNEESDESRFTSNGWDIEIEDEERLVQELPEDSSVVE